jgi:hypothetical protein
MIPMLPRFTAVSLLLLSFALVACPNTEESSGGGAPAQCQEYIQRACTLADRCKRQDKATCVSESSASIRCERTVRVTSEYDACLTALDSATCPADSSLFEIPGVCKGVIVIDNTQGAGGTGGGSGNPEAAAKCEQFSTLLCDFADGCKLQERTSCLNELSASVPCGNAAAVGATFDQCLADLKALSCPPTAEEFQLPASCSGVILLPNLLPPTAGPLQSIAEGIAALPTR